RAPLGGPVVPHGLPHVRDDGLLERGVRGALQHLRVAHMTITTREDAMTTRREFLGATAGTLAGIVFVGCDLFAATPARAQGGRRQVAVNGKRVKVVDVHAHCAVPEALALMGLKTGGPALRTELDMATEVGVRLRAMDEQGIDVQALSINPNWYKADRDL